MKRVLSKDSDTASPINKKMNTEENMDTSELEIEIPDDDASALEWRKAIFTQLVQISKQNKSMNSWKNTASKQIENLQISDKRLEDEVGKLRKENSELKEKMLYQDCDFRRNNLIFDGIRESPNETGMDLRARIVEILNHISGFENKAHLCQTDTIRRIGKRGGVKNRGILVNFKWHSDIEIILGGRTKLPSGVYVREDMPTEIENRRKHLYPVFRKAKKLDKYRTQCKLDKDRLYIKGIMYTFAPVNNLDDLPPDLALDKTCERESDNTLVFFGSGSMLSNMHSCKFKVDGISYNSSEQYIQSEKAKLFGDDASQARIMNSDNAFECKQLSHKIRNVVDSEWMENCAGIAMKGCLEKFRQNPNLKTRLLSSGNKKHCRYAKISGCIQ